MILHQRCFNRRYFEDLPNKNESNNEIINYIISHKKIPNLSYEIGPISSNNIKLLELELFSYIIYISFIYKIDSNHNLYFSEKEEKYYFYIFDFLIEFYYSEVWECGHKKLRGKKVSIIPKDLKQIIVKIKNE